jgi:hypothetical protein
MMGIFQAHVDGYVHIMLLTAAIKIQALHFGH